MRPSIVVALLFLVAACAGPTSTGRRVGEARYISAFPPGVERRWIGPEVFANRLADWQLSEGRAHCTEAGHRFPLRTLMLLDRSVEPGSGQLTVSVSTAPHSQGVAAAPGSGAPDGPIPTAGLRGVLFGAGGDHVDHRLSAMIHHRPAEDGGLLAAVDDHGRVALFDMGAPHSGGGTWSLGGPLAEGELPRLAAATTSDLARLPADGTLVLRVVALVDDAGVTALTISAHAPGDDEPISSLQHTLEDWQPDGMLGLVSHLGPAGAPGGYAFDDWRITGPRLRAHDDRHFGPIVTTHYTVSDGEVALTAQLVPGLGAPSASLRYQRDGAPVTATTVIDRDAWTATWRFRPDVGATPYAVEIEAPSGRGERHQLTGTIRAEPPRDRPFVLASLNCQKIYTGGLRWNHDGLWFPHAETARHVASHDPDLLFFAGDQIYEGDLDPVDARDEDSLILDYLYKWYRHCWSFRELTRHVPSVVIPDDHDVYHGNLWGAGGKRAVADPSRGLTAQDSGGYKHGPRFVNVVHRTQTSHLPAPVDPAPCDQGISVYFTQLDWGGLSCAVLADRQWKSSASMLVPDGRVVNGWFQDPDFDPRDADVPGAELLGPRQERFLEDWAQQSRDDVWVKVALSQTPFVNVATIPEKAAGGGVLPSLPIPEPGAYPHGYAFAADTDSGGWPQSARRRAVSLLARAGAVHLAGDQHLGSLVQYGVDEHRDAGFAFTAPAVANTWPRRWWPPIHGANPEPGAPHYTGDFEDGFGNPLTVWAVANPVQSGREPANLYDRTPGYGIVRFDPEARTATFECWPRWVDPAADDAAQYAGWPKTISLD